MKAAKRMSTLIELTLKHSLEEWPARTIHDWRALKETQLLECLILCLLSSGIKYELSLAYIQIFNEANMWQKCIHCAVTQDDIYSILKNPVRCCGRLMRYRFYASKTQQIHKTVTNIYSYDRTILSILSKCSDAYETRKTIINLCPGIGPKQASMFLRDIGYYTDFAVIDSHILRFMEMMGLMPTRIRRLGIKEYMQAERLFVNYSKRFTADISTFDNVIWHLMRTLKTTEI